MNENPYASPMGDGDDGDQRYRVLCIIMFWLSAALGAFTFIAAVLGGVQNYLAMDELGGRMPVYIPLLFVLLVCCTIGFGWSARKWGSRLIRAGLIWFLASVFLLFAGPYILLFLLYGLPN